jgi:hypothetical protein
LVEHSLGKGEVTGSIPVISSRIKEAGGGNSEAESQPSKLLVAGSIPVPRSKIETEKVRDQETRKQERQEILKTGSQRFWKSQISNLRIRKSGIR